MPPGKSSLPAPWSDFLKEVDRLLSRLVELQCVGGFVLVTRYGFPRATNDIDYLPTLAPAEQDRLLEIAGKGSSLHKQFHVYIQCIGGVTTLAENYEERLEDIFPGQFGKLRILALDPYDLVLSKLERNSPKDREDVRYLVRTVPLNRDTLLARYRQELRPYLSNGARHDLTIDVWSRRLLPIMTPSPRRALCARDDLREASTSSSDLQRFLDFWGMHAPTSCF